MALSRGLRIYCSTTAVGTVYDDDGASNGYRKNESATTKVQATSSRNNVSINIAGAVGTYAGQPTQRAWNIELFCTNPVTSVTADGASLKNLANQSTSATALSGYVTDTAAKLLHINLPSAPIAQSHTVSIHLTD